MSILILNFYPKILVHFNKWLPSLKSELVMFTRANYVEQFPDYPRVQGFDNYLDSGLVEYKALRLHERDPITRIIALDEVDIIRAGRLRDRLGIPGQTEASGVAFRDKLMMKDLVQSHGIPIANYQGLSNVLDLHDFIQAHGFPVVVKPTDGMGSSGVSVLRSWQAVDDFVSGGFPSGLMAETFVDGPMYEVDGLSVDGAVEFLSVGRYIDGCLAFKDGVGLFLELVSRDEEIFQRIRQFFLSVWAAFPAPPVTTFHCEVFHTPSDELVFGEIASRTAGARISECIRVSYGIDLDKTATQLSVGLPAEDLPALAQPRVLSAVYLIPKRSAALVRHIDEFPFPWVAEYQPRVKAGTVISGPQHSVDTIGSVVFIGANRTELMHHYQDLRTFIDSEVVWA